MSGPAPNPLSAIVKVSSTGKNGKTDFINDTFTPSFNKQVLFDRDRTGAGERPHPRGARGRWDTHPATNGTCSVSSLPLSTVQGEAHGIRRSSAT